MNAINTYASTDTLHSEILYCNDIQIDLEIDRLSVRISASFMKLALVEGQLGLSLTY